MRFFEQCERLIAAYFPGLSVAVCDSRATDEESAAVLACKYPQIPGPTLLDIARLVMADRHFLGHGLQARPLMLGGLLISTIIGNESLLHESVYGLSDMHTPEVPQNIGPPLMMMHAVGALAFAIETQSYLRLPEDSAHPPEEWSSLLANRGRTSFSGQHGLYMREEIYLRLRHGICDLFGCAVAARETGASMPEVLRLVADARSISLVTDVSAAIQSAFWQPGILDFHTTPLLDEAGGDFIRAQVPIPKQKLFSFCTDYGAGRLRANSGLLNLPPFEALAAYLNPETDKETLQLHEQHGGAVRKLWHRFSAAYDFRMPRGTEQPHSPETMAHPPVRRGGPPLK